MFATLAAGPGGRCQFLTPIRQPPGRHPDTLGTAPFCGPAAGGDAVQPLNTTAHYLYHLSTTIMITASPGSLAKFSVSHSRSPPDSTFNPMCGLGDDNVFATVARLHAICHGAPSPPIGTIRSPERCRTVGSELIAPRLLSHMNSKSPPTARYPQCFGTGKHIIRTTVLAQPCIKPVCRTPGALTVEVRGRRCVVRNSWSVECKSSRATDYGLQAES